MSEERNPTTENGAENDVESGAENGMAAEETTSSTAPVATQPVDAAAPPTPTDESSAAPSPSAEVDHEPEEAPVVTAAAEPTPAPAAPVSAPAAQAAGPTPIQTAGPKEYTPEYEVGGRSRRIHIEVRLDEVNYKNVALLGRFLDPRGRILSRRKTRVSAKVQRRVVNAIKLARHVALLPYTADQTRIVRRRR